MSADARARSARVRAVLLAICCAPVLLFLVLPVLVIVPMALTRGELLEFPPQWISIRPFLDYFHDQQWMASTAVSFKVAVLAVVLAIIAGTTAALALHNSKFAGAGLVAGIILLPMVIPLVVLGAADYLLVSRLGLTDSWVAIAISHGLLTTPLVYVAVSSSLAGLNPALIRAAESLGAGELDVFRHVYWPAIRTGVLSGAIFAFSISFDEVVVAFFLQGASTVTLPVQMFTSIQYDLTPKIAAVSSLLLAIGVVAVFMQMLAQQRTSRR